jgi:hypothetical protein
MAEVLQKKHIGPSLEPWRASNPGSTRSLCAGSSEVLGGEAPSGEALAGRSASSGTWTDKVQNLSVKNPHLFGFYNRKRCQTELIFIINYNTL